MEIETAPAAPPNSEVAGLRVGYITVGPGDSFGANLSFQHRGGAVAVWVGIGLAYGRLVGHEVPFCYAMEQVSVPEHADWTSVSVDVSGTIPADVGGSRLVDAQRFISDSEPVVGQQPPNPWGVNNWDDEVYVTEALEPQFQTFNVVGYW